MLPAPKYGTTPRSSIAVVGTAVLVVVIVITCLVESVLPKGLCINLTFYRVLMNYIVFQKRNFPFDAHNFTNCYPILTIYFAILNT